MKILVPVTFVLAVSSLIAVALFLRAWIRGRALDVIHRALDGGVTLDRELVEAIVAGHGAGHADLRRGVLLLAATVALIFFSLALDPEVGRVFRAFGTFPGFVGLTYVGFHVARLR